MIGFLRRRQPRNPFLAVVFWVLILAVTLGILFVAFYFLDNYLPGQGMF
ncbi:MAG TPA: hypothetical protein VE754_00460 [Actinomycetota bacterium]|jgi:hypothetical protein|nr:hypothetical protein [Actinomycetota bacterium]